MCGQVVGDGRVTGGDGGMQNQKQEPHTKMWGKTSARLHFFGMNSPRNRGWYQARAHTFGSGNGKGDTIVWCHGEVKKCKL